MLQYVTCDPLVKELTDGFNATGSPQKARGGAESNIGQGWGAQRAVPESGAPSFRLDVM